MLSCKTTIFPGNIMSVVTIPCLYDNYSYLLVNETSGECAVVDPSEAWPVLREVESRGLRLGAVLCTHHHQDHIGGLEDLLQECGELRVLGHQFDLERIPQLTELLPDGAAISVCGLTGSVRHVPGHTTTSVFYRFARHLFVGDTLFGAGCGRLFEGTAAQMLNSLARITEVEKDCRIYFGHEYTGINLRFARQVEPGNPAIGERQARVEELRKKELPSAPSTLTEELNTNPFLRVEQPEIIDYLAREHGFTGTAPVEVFGALRQLRNHFS